MTAHTQARESGSILTSTLAGLTVVAALAVTTVTMIGQDEPAAAPEPRAAAAAAPGPIQVERFYPAEWSGGWLRCICVTVDAKAHEIPANGLKVAFTFPNVLVTDDDGTAVPVEVEMPGVQPWHAGPVSYTGSGSSRRGHVTVTYGGHVTEGDFAWLDAPQMAIRRVSETQPTESRDPIAVTVKIPGQADISGVVPVHG